MQHLAGKISWDKNGEVSQKQHRSCLLAGNNNEMKI